MKKMYELLILTKIKILLSYILVYNLNLLFKLVYFGALSKIGLLIVISINKQQLLGSRCCLDSFVNINIRKCQCQLHVATVSCSNLRRRRFTAATTKYARDCMCLVSCKLQVELS